MEVFLCPECGNYIKGRKRIDGQNCLFCTYCEKKIEIGKRDISIRKEVKINETETETIIVRKKDKISIEQDENKFEIDTDWYQG